MTSFQVKTIQANTGKEKPVFFAKPFNSMTWIEFRRELARTEHVPMKSIELVGYDKIKYDFAYEKDENILISNVYPKNIVRY